MSVSALHHWQKVLGRLRAEEPLRVLIGERLYDAAELELSQPFQAKLRGDLVGDIEARIAELTRPENPDPSPAGPTAAMPIPQAEGAA